MKPTEMIVDETRFIVHVPRFLGLGWAPFLAAPSSIPSQTGHEKLIYPSRSSVRLPWDLVATVTLLDQNCRRAGYHPRLIHLHGNVRYHRIRRPFPFSPHPPVFHAPCASRRNSD